MPDLTFNPDWLASLGYDQLNQAQSEAIARTAYAALEWVVGHRLSAGWTDEQLDAFGALTELPAAIGDDPARGYLQEMRADYAQVVQDTLAQLEAELRSIRQDFDQSLRQWAPAMDETEDRSGADPAESEREPMADRPGTDSGETSHQSMAGSVIDQETANDRA